VLLVRRPLLYLFVSDLQPTLFRSGETNTAARHVSGSKFDGLGWQGESLRMIATAEHSSAALFRFSEDYRRATLNFQVPQQADREKYSPRDNLLWFLTSNLCFAMRDDRSREKQPAWTCPIAYTSSGHKW